MFYSEDLRMNDIIVGIYNSAKPIISFEEARHWYEKYLITDDEIFCIFFSPTSLLFYKHGPNHFSRKLAATHLEENGYIGTRLY